MIQLKGNKHDIKCNINSYLLGPIKVNLRIKANIPQQSNDNDSIKIQLNYLLRARHWSESNLLYTYFILDEKLIEQD